MAWLRVSFSTGESSASLFPGSVRLRLRADVRDLFTVSGKKDAENLRMYHAHVLSCSAPGAYVDG
jgi:hypothetical protein